MSETSDNFHLGGLLLSFCVPVRSYHLFPLVLLSSSYIFLIITIVAALIPKISGSFRVIFVGYWSF